MIQSNEDNTIAMRGWLYKTSDIGIFSQSKRYYFVLFKDNNLSYYKTEDIKNHEPIEKYEIRHINPLTSTKNGLLLLLSTGKDLELVADTHVSYKEWYFSIKNIIQLNGANVSSTSTPIGKSGWIDFLLNSNNVNTNHFIKEDLQWNKYYMVLKKDLISCYHSEDSNSQLEISGILRGVQEWNNNNNSNFFGLIIRLNKKRKIFISFSTSEEKLSWLLTLEFQISQLVDQMKEKKKQIKAQVDNRIQNDKISTPIKFFDNKPRLIENSISSKKVEDDGVWI